MQQSWICTQDQPTIRLAAEVVTYWLVDDTTRWYEEISCL